MDTKKFAVVSITLPDHKNTCIHDADLVKDWIHGRSNPLNRLITPLAYLADGPDNPVEESTLDISYHIEFQEFTCELIEDDSKEFQIGDKTVSLSKAKLDLACIDTGVEPDMVRGNEYKLWHNDKCQFIEVAYKGFKHSPNNNPTLTLMHDGVIKPSIFAKALMGDDNG